MKPLKLSNSDSSSKVIWLVILEQMNNWKLVEQYLPIWDLMETGRGNSGSVIIFLKASTYSEFMPHLKFNSAKNFS